MTEQTGAQGDRSVAVGRDVMNSIINTGDHNQFFIGDYERLRDAYIEPWSVFERVDLDHFVGREWLLAEVDAFLRNHDRGYFILEAKAGLGKTTFLAWLTRERGYIHHFAELAPGLDCVGRGLKNLAAQLVLAYHLSKYEAEGVLPGAAAQPDYLLRLLKQASDQRRGEEKIVLVVDALDEACAPEKQNVLGLPRVLPDGVFIIVSQRPVPVTLQVDTATTPRRHSHLVADSDENQDDMRRFLEIAITWPGISKALQDSVYTIEQFVTTLVEKCRGVWVYLHYVVHEIERGERSPLDLEALPDGMTQYCARYWQGWRDEDEEKWYGVYLPLLTTLAAGQETVTAERLAEWASVEISVQRLHRLLSERWRPFLDITGQGKQACYRFYHATLREFFDGRVEREKLSLAEQAFLNELVTATREAHHRLAERYLTAWGGLEEGLPGLQEAARREIDEGYGLRHLTAHLEASGRAEELHRLLAIETREQRNAWYEAKDAVADAAGYVAGLARAWRLAEETYVPGNSILGGQSMGLQCRYALITASLNSLSGSIRPGLMAALVEKGIWAPPQALVYARQVPEVRVRVVSLAALARHLPELLRQEALEEALAAVPAIELEYDQASALANLAPHLTGGLLERALDIAQTIGEVYPEGQALALKALAPHLPRSLLAEALGQAVMIGDQESRAEALVGVVPHFPEPVSLETLLETLDATHAIWDNGGRAQALATIASHLPQPLKDEVREDALTTARAVQSNQRRTRTLVRLAAHLSDPLKGEVLMEALDAARTIADKHGRAMALATLGAHLPKRLKNGVLKEALETARAISHEGSRAKALTALVPYLSKREKGDALRDALVVALELLDWTLLWRPRTEMLAALAPHLSEPLLQEALERVCAIADERYRFEALAALAPHLPESGLEEALRATWTIDDQEDRAKALVALAPNLPQSYRGDTLEAARAIGHEYDRAMALATLVPQLLEPLREEALQEALEAAHTVGDDDDRARALATIASCTPQPLNGKTVQQALEAAQLLCHEYTLVEVLQILGPHLPEARLEEALEMARMISDKEDRAMAVGAIASRLPEPIKGGVVHDTLGAALKIEDNYQRTHALCALVPHLRATLRKELLREALETARSMGHQYFRALALADLCFHLSEPLKEEALSEALAAARAIDAHSVVDDPDEWPREEALAAVAPHLAQPCMQEVLCEAQAIDEGRPRAEILCALAPGLAQLSDIQLYPLWHQTIHHLAARTRKDLLVDIVCLQPVIAALGGEEALAETASAILDVGRWWP